MSQAVIFDLGGVLIDWNPRHLYRKLFGDEAEMERFLDTVCTPAWNAEQDAGRPIAVAVAELSARHPEHSALIEAFYARWPEMLAGAIEDSVAVLARLRALGVPLYALTNWSAETFPLARARFDFLGWFRGIVVSGEVGMKKPDPAIFRLCLERFALAPGDAVFIDDAPANVAAAEALGLTGLRFTSAAGLDRELRALGLL